MNRGEKIKKPFETNLKRLFLMQNTEGVIKKKSKRQSMINL